MNLTAFQSNKPIREIAYENLKYAIVTGDLPAGSRIIETDYAERLHISRTPLREALRKLERDGLVEYIARRGVVVRAFTIEDIEEIYTIRNALELITLPAIIENATKEDIAFLDDLLEQMDPLVKGNDIEKLSPLARQFHSYLTSIAKLNRILRVIESQDEYIKRFSQISIARESRREEAHQEHHELLRCVKNKELLKFRALTKAHIERSKEMCLLALEEETKLRKHRDEKEKKLN